MRCLSTASANCTGSLTLRTAKPIRLAGSSAVLELGETRFEVAPGTSKTVRVRLTKRTERLGDRNGRLRVRALARAGASGNIAQSSRLLTLALGTARHTGKGSH